MPADFDVIDEWQAALERYGCRRREHLRACLIGSLAARLQRVPGGADLFRESINDALTFGGERR